LRIIELFDTIVFRFFLVWTTFSLDARRPSGVAVDARDGTGDGVGGDTRMRDEIALVERARVVVADDGARARRDAVARATTRRLILTFETTGTATTTGAGSAAEGGTVIEYDDVAACERARESRSTLGGLFRRRERGVALLLTSGRRVTIGARGASAEEVCGKIENAIVKYKRQKATAAVETTREDARRRASGASAATAGVGGAVNRQLERAEATNKTMDEAFTDLRALMAKAGEMVTLAERLAESMDGKGESSELQRLVLSLGITSPVTRANAGAEFHRELGKQLADWITPVVQKSNGIITVTDAFCLFNRARGTELVSPQDMLRASESWESLGVDLHLRKFESGVMVIHTVERTDEEACARLLARLPSYEHSIDSYEAAQILATTPEIALEYLYMAESRGVLCRDDGPAQMRFYANMFEARLT
jgi:ESCRT-II complex subunit VPS36